MTLSCPKMSEQGWMNLRGNIRRRIVMFYAPGSSCTRPRGSRTMSLPHVSIRRVKLYPSGANAFSSNVFRASMNNRVAAPPHAFPPGVVVAVKALACELPHRVGKPLSRFSLSELRREVVGAGLVGFDQRHHGLAVAQPGRSAPLAASYLDLPPGSCVCRESRAHSRSVSRTLGG